MKINDARENMEAPTRCKPCLSAAIYIAEMNLRLAELELSKLESYKANGVRIPKPVFAVVKKTLRHLEKAIEVFNV